MAAIPVPSANCLLVVDQSFQDRQTAGVTPGAALQAWLVPIPTGQTAGQAASAFAQQQNVPVNSVALLLDFSVSPPAYSSHQLVDGWIND